jgi:hypothetical protein
VPKTNFEKLLYVYIEVEFRITKYVGYYKKGRRGSNIGASPIGKIKKTCPQKCSKSIPPPFRKTVKNAAS